MSLAFDCDDARLFQNAHVMGDGRLREFNAVFDVAGAKAGRFFLKKTNDAAAGGIGDGVDEGVKVGIGASHKEEGYQRRIGNFVICKLAIEPEPRVILNYSITKLQNYQFFYFFTMGL